MGAQVPPGWKPPVIPQKITDTRPKRGARGFECPNCGALAHQEWAALRFSPGDSDLSLPLGPILGDETLSGAFCVACHGKSLWIGEQMIWPLGAAGPQPAEGMPDDVKTCYEEARQVYPISPKSAGALLRLGLEKLLVSLGQNDTIDTAIGNLVKAGVIDEHTQRAMDAMRVIGNSAVHPGFIDLDEEPETASFLFELMNIIVNETITKKQRVAKLYAKMPSDKLKGIEERAKRIK